MHEICLKTIFLRIFLLPEELYKKNFRRTYSGFNLSSYPDPVKEELDPAGQKSPDPVQTNEFSSIPSTLSSSGGQELMGTQDSSILIHSYVYIS